MNIGWIKLTPAQTVALAELSASNPGHNFISPMADAAGDQWISADALTERAGLFAHYAAWLDTLASPQVETPTWPAENI